jgi:hypothetical protein
MMVMPKGTAMNKPAKKLERRNDEMERAVDLIMQPVDPQVRVDEDSVHLLFE